MSETQPHISFSSVTYGGMRHIINTAAVIKHKLVLPECRTT